MMQRANPHDIDRVVQESDMAPEDGRDWRHSSIPGRWWVPDIIAIEDEMLCWEPQSNAGRWVEPTSELLGQFLQIHQFERWDQWHDAVLRFARTWGPLHLCHDHGQPVWHRQDQWGLQVGEAILPVCRPLVLADGRVAEPLWRWLSFSYLARDVVHARTLVRPSKSKPKSERDHRIRNMLMAKPDRGHLVAHVHRLIEDGMGFAVRPEWTSSDDVPVWRAEVRTLAAALGVALWNTLRGSPGVAICANCLSLFETRQRNQRYCDKSACQTERKRVEKVQLRARKAASATLDPEYAI
jgi:hypothetical protein